MAKESGWLQALKIYLGAHLAIVGVVVVGGIVVYLISKKKGDRLSAPEMRAFTTPEPSGAITGGLKWDGEEPRIGPQPSMDEVMDKMFQNDSEGMGSYHGGIS